MNSVLPSHARESLRHLEFFARRMIEGMRQGLHRSRRIGVSIEFDHHKLYQPGDPLKHIDWKVSARQDRYFVKRYLEDTAMGVKLVLDCSGSMRKTTGESDSKYLQACRVIACLAYLVIKQKDAAGLVLDAQGAPLWLPNSSAGNHLVRILEALVKTSAAGENALDKCLQAVLERGERKGMVVLVSDLMFDPAPVRKQLTRLQAQGHEVLLVQLRDRMEEEFEFNRWVQFEDLERAGLRRRIDAVPLKKIYREEYRKLLDGWRAWAKKYDLHFVTFRSEGRVDKVLSEYLAVRAGMGGGQ